MSRNRLSRTELTRITRGRFKRVHGAFFSLTVSSLQAGESSKFTCAVSVKVARKATERNRIKRLCREVAREEIKKQGSPRTFVFYAKRGSHNATYDKVVLDVRELIRKASL